METLLSMNTKELSRLEVMQRLSKKQMSQKEAGEILHLGNRQIKRLLKSYGNKGRSDWFQNIEVEKGITVCRRA